MLSPQSLEELEELQRILRQKDRRSKHEKKLFSTQKMMDEMLLQVSASEAQLRGSLQQSPPVATSASDPLPPTPADWPEALSGPNAKEWTAAREEKVGIDNHGTWEDAPDYKGRTAKSRWAFRVSRELGGTIKFRARLIDKGFSERKGIDYFETFAPTVSLKALLSILHLAASNDWEIRSMDVGKAYLEATLDTDIYMDLPAEGNQPPRRVKLIKSVYGLKQAGELWNKLLDKTLRDLGFKRSFSDPCIYVRIKSVFTLMTSSR